MSITIGIIGALPEEIHPYREVMTNVSSKTQLGLEFISGGLCGHRIVAVECGVGKTNAALGATLLISAHGAEAIVFTGVCGGLADSLRVFDTVISECSAHHDLPVEFLTSYRPHLPGEWLPCGEALLAAARLGVAAGDYGDSVHFGKVVTGEVFVHREGREEIISRFNPLCVDMETASVAQVAFVAGVPYIAVRTVSDTEDGSGIDAFRLNCGLAAEKSFDVVCAMLRSLEA